MNTEQQLTARLKLETTEKEKMRAKFDLRDRYAKGQDDVTEKYIVRRTSPLRPP